MTARAKRYGFLAIGAFAILAAASCGVLAFLESHYAPEAAMWLGLNVGCCLLLILAASTALDTPELQLLAITGIATAIFTMGFFSFVILDEVFSGPRFSSRPHIGQWMLTSAYTAGLLCVVPCVIAPSMTRVGEILQTITALVIFFYYLLSLNWFWDFVHEPILEQSCIVFGLFGGAGALSVFVLHRFFGVRVRDPLSTFDQLVFLRCPRCLREQEVPVGESRCGGCALRFTIDVEEPACPGCGYNLRGLARPQCPECGEVIGVGGAGSGEMQAAPL